MTVIPATHIRKEDNLYNISCEGCDYIQYFSDAVTMKDLLHVSEAHYQTHLQSYYTDLRSRFRGKPDRYQFSRKKEPSPTTHTTQNPSRSNRTTIS